MAIFSDFIGESLDVFIDDFLVFGSSFDTDLEHLMRILDVCVKKRLVLSCKNYHFMVREGTVLGHLTVRFMQSLKHTNVGQIKFIILNSQIQKYKI